VDAAVGLAFTQGELNHSATPSRPSSTPLFPVWLVGYFFYLYSQPCSRVGLGDSVSE
jgi:hypothetical protein